MSDTEKLLNAIKSLDKYLIETEGINPLPPYPPECFIDDDGPEVEVYLEDKKKLALKNALNAAILEIQKIYKVRNDFWSKIFLAQDTDNFDKFFEGYINIELQQRVPDVP